MLTKRLAEKAILMISFMSKRFSYKYQIEELFIVTISVCIFQTRNIFNILVNLNFLTATYYLKARYQLVSC